MNTYFHNGYTVRPVTMDDLPSAVDLFNAESWHINGTPGATLEAIRGEWELPLFQLAEDTLAVFDAQNRMVGYAELWDTQTAHVGYHLWTAVHPEQLGKGIGSLLNEWGWQRAQKSLPKAVPGARVYIRQWISDKNEPAKSLLARCGWQDVRLSYRMQIDFDGPVAAPVLPEGIVIRSIQGPEEQRAAIYAAYDSFQDHWGRIEEPFEPYYERWMHHVKHNPHYDPSLWFIALDGDQVAGISLCNDHMEEDPQLGWIGTLGVLRPWRKHGLGLALLQHSFAEFARRGFPRVALGVDASSLTGATRLYERGGMRVVRLYHTYEREVRPGKELSVTALR